MSDPFLPSILIVAPNASVRFGGEAILPLHYFRFLAGRGHPVLLLTHHRNRAELLSLPEYDPERIFFIPDTLWHRIIWKTFVRSPDRVRDLIGGGLLAWVDEVCQARLIRGIIRKHQVDLIHQPTPVSPLMPTNLHRFGVPLVVGPMNGGMDYPKGYENYEARSTRIAIILGRSIAKLLNRIKPGKHHATALLVANERTRKALPFPDHPKVEILVENGVDLNLWKAEPIPKIAPPAGRLRLIYVGRLIRLKGIDITLQAIALARSQGADVTLELLGDGEERASLEALAISLGLQEQVVFHGFLTQDACVAVMSRSDMLILNSLKECGGAVILEAMAMGLPVIASAWGGPLDYITPDCGILVDPVPREDFINRLASAITKAAWDPETRRRMGQAGRDLARRTYDWNAKVDRILEIYRDAVGAEFENHPPPTKEEQPPEPIVPGDFS